MTTRRIRTGLLGCAVMALSMAACGDDDPVAVDSNADPRLGTITLLVMGASSDVYDSFHITTTLLGAPDLLILERDIADNDHADPRMRGALLMDSSDPSFPAVVVRLTDGVDQTLQYRFVAGASTTTYTQPTSSRIDFDIARPNGEPDFVGYHITALRLTVVHANFDSPGSDLNGNGIWTDYDVTIRIDVEGQPE